MNSLDISSKLLLEILREHITWDFEVKTKNNIKMYEGGLKSFPSSYIRNKGREIFRQNKKTNVRLTFIYH
jgi:hypothetical protein